MASVRTLPWTALEADNLTSLAELTEENLLKAIKERYGANLIYTAVGDILVAVNPFCSLPMYDDAWSKAYREPDVSGLAPHIYRVAAAAYNSLVQGKKNQVCVISGESGAGKTESAKFIMKQVMDMCRSAGLGHTLQQKIIQLNPLLEAFGNARTELNDNSSRFGKFIQLLFLPNGRIVGAGLEQYLLEKSRICVQGERERNFHIFYYLYAGLSEENKAQFHLKSPMQHHYLQTYCHLNRDCSSEESRTSFKTVLDSMQSIGFSQEEVQQVLTILAAVLHLGDIEFVSRDGGDSAAIRNPQLVETVSELLHLESSEELAFALTTLRTMTRGEPVDKLYTCSKAVVVRDAAAKALYARMFQWIISRINNHLQPRPSDDYLNIGILDIFGFENFEMNSFEQFCINLANEQLQQYFNHQIFAMEKMECAREGVDDLDITFNDNTPVIDLFLARPIGLLCLLDEQCKGLNGTEKAFVQRCRESFTKHTNFRPHRGNAPEFTIKHYAGDVTYEMDGFLEKNRDTLPDTVADALRYTSLRLLRVLFTSHPNYGGEQLRKSILRKDQRSVMRAMSHRRRHHSRSPQKQRQGRKRLLTVSAHFRESLDLLMERLFAASPHFVRCVKPNLQKQPNNFQSDFVLKQLKYTGMLEAVRVRREGYSYRPFFSDFVASYRAVAYDYTDESIRLTEATCQVILKKAGLTGWRLAKSRVFLRYYHEQKLQLILKAMEDAAIVIQRRYRGHRTRKWTKPLREKQRLQKLQVSRMLTRLAEIGQIHQPIQKEMNRIDILEAPERFKDKRKSKPVLTEAGPSSADYEGLTTSQKKVKKAKKFGVMIAGFGGGPPDVALRSPKSPTRMRPPSNSDDSLAPPPFSPRAPEGIAEGSSLSSSSSPSPSHFKSTDTATNPSVQSKPPTGSNSPSSPMKKSRFPFRDQAPSNPNTASTVASAPSGQSRTDPPVPKPRLKKLQRKKNVGKRVQIEGSGSGTGEEGSASGQPPPSPKEWKRTSVWSFRSSGASDEYEVMTSQHRLSKELEEETPARPEVHKKSVNGDKILPRGRTSLSNELDNRGLPQRPPGPEILRPTSMLQDPVPKPRRLHYENNYVQPRSNADRNLSQEQLPPWAISFKTLPLSSSTSSSSSSISKHIATSSSNADALITMRRPVAAVGNESSLDYRQGNPHSKFSSNSVPNLLEDPSDPYSSQSPSHNPHSSQSPSHNSHSSQSPSHAALYPPRHLLRARGLASSSSDLLEDTPCHWRYSGVSSSGSGSVAGSVVSDQPPQADRRKAGRGWFNWRRGSRKKSDSSESGGDIPLSPPPSHHESDTQLLGFYPQLTYDGAVEMVAGQPRGTYVIFKEDPRLYSGQSCVYKLGVSGGRDVRMFPIHCTTNGRGLQFHINVANGQASSFPSLKSLVDNHKTNELSEGLLLAQPRLVAGISVAGVKLVKKPVPMGIGRIKNRRKI